MHRDQDKRDAMAAVFAEADVAKSYAGRPPYAPALFAHLLAQVPGRGRALDIGCGPGTIATRLADHFAEVTALDPSGPMIEAGKASDAGRHPNIVWVQTRAEDLTSDDGFDLVTAGTSIHWPDHAVLFPKLASWTTNLAVISNAATVLHCAETASVDFLKRWLGIMAARTPGVRKPYDPVGFAAENRRFERWVDVVESRTFEHRVLQPIEIYLDAQHSMATFCRSAMGETLAAAYDAELDALVRPHSEAGSIELSCVSTLTLGRPRATPKGTASD
jgi:SAM-dependent methyltransferase